ncbi:putative zinc finger protein kinase [Leptomonas pyrrhocoris]|uniref:Putative zinc finger protein kinase n=1 Tax=Leptomonas pyrrhocoris TaxID=157538 RepID=A0A0N0VHJ3_LEPPY|nr:putative zinc finger protein kinase [Leptomonas pyrrhocoris]KPA85298.1 putative zinc finger protein kinase [Leptomonas pyrrhocoris]|eukprot:XP_015663737.1 putative zinc finger protein kinase [Leptomonas pyrrhocoris]
MFYRLFGKPSNAKSSSGANGTGAAGSAGAPGSTAVSAAGATNSTTTGAATGEVNAAPPLHDTPLSESSSAGSGGVRGGWDRRAFEGEERLLERPRWPRRYPLDPEIDAELLVLLAQQYSITSVVITHYRVKENYVEYVIECVRGYDAWRVYRRYQQFKTLDHDLRQLCVGRHGSNHGAYGVVPVLPGSHWMDVTNQSPELVEQRRRYLEIYLQQLLVQKNLFYVARTALFDFLHDGEVPTHLKITGIQPLLGLISTRTNQIDCDDTDEAIEREQQQQQRPSSTAHREGEPQQPVSAPPDAFQCTFPAAQLEDAGAEGTQAKESNSDNAKGGSTSAAEGEGAQPTAKGAQRTCSSSAPGNTQSPNRRGISASTATFSNLRASGERENRDENGGDVHDGEGPADNVRPKKYPRTLADEFSFVATAALQMSFTDERLPPASANCAQCNAEFTSFLYPHRCFFCRVQFCTSCLQKVSMLEGGGTAPVWAAPPAKERVPSSPQTANALGEAPSVVARNVLACRQCAENYSRRLDRCITAAGGGAYRGMQSTLGTPAYGATGSSTGGASPHTSLAAAAPSSLSPMTCVGEEQSSMMLQKRGTGPGSPQRRGSPTGSFAGRSGSLSAVGFGDFQLLTVIGRGTFGKVLKVQQRSTGKVYAMKIMNKSTVYKRCMTSYMKEEKSILTTMKPHPYIVRCYYAFQTDYYLVFIMDYLPGGELYDYLYPKLRLTPEAACVYAAELVLALEHLHRQDVVHRDLKPENVVLTADGHICLTDFGLARRAFSRSRRRSFVGSPEYVAPETIQGQVQTAAVDWWGFGIMLYEMLTGCTPFHARNNNTVYDNVLHKELKLPLLKTEVANAAGGDQVVAPSFPGFPRSAAAATAAAAVAAATTTAGDTTGFKGFTAEAASLLSGLLARDPSMRLQDAAVIKKHPFFRTVDWDALRRKDVGAPCIPGDLRDNDVRHFKREFVSEWASVPPLTNMTRASIDALTRCFENFPLSRTSDSSLSSSFASSAVSPTAGLSQPAKSGANGGHPEMRVLSPSLTLLPPSVLSADGRTLREPVRFGDSTETALKCFHGVWRVVSVEVHALKDGRVIFPWGGSVGGLLVYSSDARFSLQLSPNTRRPMGPVQRVGQLSKEDLCDAYCSYVASFGRFQIFPSSTDDGCGVVRHHAEGNLCPNLMLTNTVFQYRMDVEPMSKSTERPGMSEEQSALDGKSGSLNGATEAVPKSAQVPGKCDSDSSADGRVTHRESGALSREAETTLTPVDNAEAQRGATASPPATPPKRRYVLRLSTRPQRAFEEDFMAFTSLVFEKLE